MSSVSRNSSTPPPSPAPIEAVGVAGAEGGEGFGRIRNVSQSSDTSHTTGSSDSVFNFSIFRDWTLSQVNGDLASFDFCMTLKHRLADGSIAAPCFSVEREESHQVDADVRINGNVGRARGTLDAEGKLILSTHLMSSNPPENDSPDAMEQQGYVVDLFANGLRNTSVSSHQLILTTQTPDDDYVDVLNFIDGTARTVDQPVQARYHKLLDENRYPQHEWDHRDRRGALEGLTRLHMSGELDLTAITPNDVLGEWYVKMVGTEDFYPRVKLTWEKCEDDTLVLTRDYKTEIAGGQVKAISRAVSTLVGAAVKTEEESSPLPTSDIIRNFLFWDGADPNSPLTELEQKEQFDRTVIVSKGDEYLLFVTGDGKSVLLERKGADPYLTCRQAAQWNCDLSQFSEKSATIDHSARTDERSDSVSGFSDDDQGFSEDSDTDGSLQAGNVSYSGSDIEYGRSDEEGDAL